ncbi:11224_t:CDS:2 [Paraglomus occultum]|uniref:DASH complex subunit DAD4 n=1 Tax=Paraglomus occultum TaxID=144539 RepID=A0A9N9B7I9_9GLOM|nr:11224_t:CDS:2 [Paraglomus occultum]
MENPHEEQQNSLLSRIISNVQKLNDVLEDVNERMDEINQYNEKIGVLSQVWANYSRNVMFNLQSIKKLEDPI